MTLNIIYLVSRLAMRNMARVGIFPTSILYTFGSLYRSIPTLTSVYGYYQTIRGLYTISRLLRPHLIAVTEGTGNNARALMNTLESMRNFQVLSTMTQFRNIDPHLINDILSIVIPTLGRNFTSITNATEKVRAFILLFSLFSGSVFFSGFFRFLYLALRLLFSLSMASVAIAITDFIPDTLLLKSFCIKYFSFLTNYFNLGSLSSKPINDVNLHLITPPDLLEVDHDSNNQKPNPKFLFFDYSSLRAVTYFSSFITSFIIITYYKSSVASGISNAALSVFNYFFYNNFFGG